jgi:hypothetical protein
MMAAPFAGIRFAGIRFAGIRIAGNFIDSAGAAA